MLKKITATFLLCAVMLINPIQGYALSNNTYLKPEASKTCATISPRYDVTEWYYKVVDNTLYRRLWSRTYAKWLTEWELDQKVK